jgi:5'-3' exonuclease
MNKSLILVDISYTVFYRFFATIKWYSFAYKEEFSNLPQNYNWINNEIIKNKYKKMFLESIIKLVNKKIFNSSNIIFCLDTPKEDLWRTKIQSSYKSKRPELKYKFDDVFIYTYNILLPEIIKSYNNINIIKINNIEADDIIALISIYFKKNYPNNKIYLISGDTDFYQLGYENLIFLNYKSKKKLILTEDEALLELKKKIIFGDKSDCIPSIITKRIKNKNKLLDDEKLKEYLFNNPDALIKYNNNDKMINFNNIPNEYYIKIIKELDKFYN